MCWGAGKSLQLAVRTGDTVESLSDVSGTFQQHVLQEIKYSDQQPLWNVKVLTATDGLTVCCCCYFCQQQDSAQL